MKLKTALELLGNDGHSFLCMTSTVSGPFGESMAAVMELVARRAREEAYEMAAMEAEYFAKHSSTAKLILRAIRELPTEPK